MTQSRVILSVCAALALALPAAAQAKDKDKGRNGPSVHLAQGCPPGLAKKNPPCVPPGQAKKIYRGDDGHHDTRHNDDDHHHDADTRHYDYDGDRPIIYSDRYDNRYHYRIGEYVNGDYIVVESPGLYGLDPDATYYRVQDQIYQVDQQTREILAVIGLAQRILN